MKTYYEIDREIIDAMSPIDRHRFDLWMADLEAIMDRHKERYGERPYGEKSLAASTGLNCWKDCFDDGMTPREAFDEDKSCWDTA